MLQRDVLDEFLRYFNALEAGDVVVPLLSMAPFLSDADLGTRLEEESGEAACLLGCVQAFYVYGEAREHYSSLRTVLIALRRGQAEQARLLAEAEEERLRAAAASEAEAAVEEVAPSV